MNGDPALGVVGLGGMGTRHAGNLAELGARIVAGADPDPDARAAFAEAFDAAVHESAAAMYDAESLDCVVITAPNAVHEPAAVGALERGVHALVEKPLAHTVESARAIADAAAASDAFCTVGFSYRFCAAADLFRAERERFGEITHIEAAYVRRRGIPGRGSWFTDSELAGGGSLIDLGVHAIDFALYLAGFPEVVEVSGTTRSDFGTDPDYADPDGWADNWETGGGFDVDDSASAFLRCADGTTVSLETAWATNREPEKRVRVRGTDAGAELDIGGERLRVLDAGTAGVAHYADEEMTGRREREGHEAEDARFLEGVRAGEAPELNTVGEALTVQRVADAVYRSAEAGRAVRLD
jgi:predicted dehydrogenase